MTPEERKLQLLETQVKEVRGMAYSMERKLDQVIGILKGDEYGNIGIVKQIERNRDKISKLEALKDRATWTVLGLTIPSGYGMWEVLRKLF